ncbi:MAG: N-acetyl-gamma-glutamyl-phosphate reductase [Candidatus Omnitrophota bacterium]|jgi:N-acetyl-gamma-glutamyl-phosphate reductase
MINVGIAGATGYTGEELITILLRHPGVRITNVSASSDRLKLISELIPKFSGRIGLMCNKLSVEQLIKDCDLVFLALPHTVSMDFVPKLLKAGKRVIDLSADYRLKDTDIYEQFYQVAHKDKANLKTAVYGLPELYRQKIKNARLIANPGCYPTAAIIGLAPVIAINSIDTSSIIIDAKSGVTGAGKKLSCEYLFSEVDEDFRAYKVNAHQHAPEIVQILSKLSREKVRLTFVPHLLPLKRGILETMYIRTKNAKKITQDLLLLYRKFYQKEPFVRIKEEGFFPSLKDVVGTNFCDIGIKTDGDTVIIIAVIDNLLKGASGQAVQNLNIMFGFPEKTAL